MDLSKSTTAIEACSCWTNSEYSETSEVVKNCKIDVVQQIAKAHSNCTGTFSVCRKYEDAVVDIFAFCTSGKLHFVWDIIQMLYSLGPTVRVALVNQHNVSADITLIFKSSLSLSITLPGNTSINKLVERQVLKE